MGIEQHTYIGFMGYHGNGAIHIYRVYGISWEWSNTHLTGLWEWSNTHLTSLWDIKEMEQYTSIGFMRYQGNGAIHI